ncbi:hypothetical protein IWQ61_003147 [Dispira simplex]|nr:hypothetical protein IWQ61_003147 [Dispira simplex]
MPAPIYAILSAVQPYCPPLQWTVAALISLTIIILTHYLVRHHRQKRQWRAQFTEPRLITDHSQLTMVRGKPLRTLFIEHEQGREVPLFFFIHGAGSSMAVWESQLTRLQVVANMLAVDLVGYGGSARPSEWEPYTTASLLQDLRSVLMRYGDYKLVIIGHSYGNCLATKLYPLVRDRVAGMVFVAPGDVTYAPHVTRLLQLPNWGVNLLRLLDRYGGINSTSVRRMLSPSASRDLKEQQLYWNEQSRTDVFRRVMLGMDWICQDDLKALTCPLLLLPGEFDLIHPVPCSYAIKECVATPNVSIVVAHQAGHQVMLEKPELTNNEILRFVGEECGFPTFMNFTL